MRVDDFYWTHTRNQVVLLLRYDAELERDGMLRDSVVMLRTVSAAIGGDKDGKYSEFLDLLRAPSDAAPAAGPHLGAALAASPHASIEDNTLDEDEWGTLDDGAG